MLDSQYEQALEKLVALKNITLADAQRYSLAVDIREEYFDEIIATMQAQHELVKAMHCPHGFIIGSPECEALKCSETWVVLCTVDKANGEAGKC